LTIREYYKHFVGVFGGITAIISGIPLISDVFPARIAKWLFPPLGPNDGILRIFVVIVAVIVTIIVFFNKDKDFIKSKKRRVRCLVWLLVPLVFALVSYAVLNWRFVKSISIPHKDEEILLSVGFDRTTFAQKEFAQVNDWELLKARGPTEEEIWRLWTSTSIITTRGGLLLSYLLFLASAVAVGSFAVLYDKDGTPPNP
jgi:hypothetical protein